MKRITMAAALAGATALSAGAAMAATMTTTFDLAANDDNVVRVGIVEVGQTVELRFTAEDDLDVSDISIGVTGTSGGNDVNALRFGFDEPPSMVFDPVVISGGSAFGGGNLGAMSYSAGEMFSVFIGDIGGLTNSTGFTVSFQTAAAAVPLPAAGGLLGFALLGAGMASRRRKAA